MIYIYIYYNYILFLLTAKQTRNAIKLGLSINFFCKQSLNINFEQYPIAQPTITAKITE